MTTQRQGFVQMRLETSPLSSTQRETWKCCGKYYNRSRKYLLAYEWEHIYVPWHSDESVCRVSSSERITPFVWVKKWRFRTPWAFDITPHSFSERERWGAWWVVAYMTDCWLRESFTVSRNRRVVTRWPCSDTERGAVAIWFWSKLEVISRVRWFKEYFIILGISKKRIFYYFLIAFSWNPLEGSGVTQGRTHYIMQDEWLDLGECLSWQGVSRRARCD